MVYACVCVSAWATVKFKKKEEKNNFDSKFEFMLIVV